MTMNEPFPWLTQFEAPFLDLRHQKPITDSFSQIDGFGMSTSNATWSPLLFVPPPASSIDFYGSTPVLLTSPEWSSDDDHQDALVPGVPLADNSMPLFNSTLNEQAVQDVEYDNSSPSSSDDSFPSHSTGYVKSETEHGNDSIKRLSNRHAVHNESERRRQRSINGAIDELREMVPGCQEHRISKATILARSARFIEQTCSQLNRYKKENESLKEALNKYVAMTGIPLEQLQGSSKPVNAASSLSPRGQHSPLQQQQQQQQQQTSVQQTSVQQASVKCQQPQQPIDSNPSSAKPGSKSQRSRQFINVKPMRAPDAPFTLLMVCSAYLIFWSPVTDVQELSAYSSRMLLSTTSSSESQEYLSFAIWFGLMLFKMLFFVCLYRLVLIMRGIDSVSSRESFDQIQELRLSAQKKIANNQNDEAKQDLRQALYCVGWIDSEQDDERSFFITMSMICSFLFHVLWVVADIFGLTWIGWLYICTRGIAPVASEISLILYEYYKVTEAEAHDYVGGLQSFIYILAALNIEQCTNPNSNLCIELRAVVGGIIMREPSLHIVGQHFETLALSSAEKIDSGMVDKILSFRREQSIEKKRDFPIGNGLGEMSMRFICWICLFAVGPAVTSCLKTNQQ